MSYLGFAATWRHMHDYCFIGWGHRAHGCRSRYGESAPTPQAVDFCSVFNGHYVVCIHLPGWLILVVPCQSILKFDLSGNGISRVHWLCLVLQLGAIQFSEMQYQTQPMDKGGAVLGNHFFFFILYSPFNIYHTGLVGCVDVCSSTMAM